MEDNRKMSPARFIEEYNRLGIRFDLQAGVVASIGGSPAFCEWVRAHSAWLKPWLGVQSVVRVQVEQPSVKVESSAQDAKLWRSIENARRNEEKVKQWSSGRQWRNRNTRKEQG